MAVPSRFHAVSTRACAGVLSAKGPSRVPTRFRLGYATDELELAGSKYYINILYYYIDIHIFINLIFVCFLTIYQTKFFSSYLIISIEIIKFPCVNLFNVTLCYDYWNGESIFAIFKWKYLFNKHAKVKNLMIFVNRIAEEWKRSMKSCSENI